MTDTKENIHCSNCLRVTSHSLLYDKKTVEHSGDWSSSGYYYRLYECCGCHNVVMQKAYWGSEIDHRDYDDSYITWYPALVHRQIPKWHKKLPDREKELLKETFQALYANNKSLALMGLRALLDMFIVRKIGDKGNFGEKLKKLKKDGYLTPTQVETLESAIDAGSAASHRAYIPSNEVLTLILDIVETLLHQDVLSSETSVINNEVPARHQG